MPKPPIQMLAEKLLDAKAMEYGLQYQALKTYIHDLSEIAFLAEIARVDNHRIFRYLWSIGLTYNQQQIAAMRWEELTK